MALAREIGAGYAEKDALQVMTEMYESAKIYDSAFFYLTEYISLKDTLLNEENIEEIKRWQLRAGIIK